MMRKLVFLPVALLLLALAGGTAAQSVVPDSTN